MVETVRTQVGIVGAGPAGLLLSHLLALQGIDSVILENRSRAYVEARIRAGVLEHQTVQLLTDAGLGERLHREGMRHDGVILQWPGERHRLDLRDLVDRSVWVYGQAEVVKDLIATRVAAGQALHFEAADVAVHDVETDTPRLTWTDTDGGRHEVRCDVIAGCDGFHGVSRAAIPADVLDVKQRTYPFSWLGVLAEAPPPGHEVTYAWHPEGFALHSMRSPQISRLYLQVDPSERIEDWSDDRIWSALTTRLQQPGRPLVTGPIIEKAIAPMRSFVATPMQHGRLFLAGDAAHIVPPTGAKGLNLAVADVKVLTEAIVAYAKEARTDLLAAYTETALRRVWRATHFSWWMTSMMHTRQGAEADEFERHLQLTQLRQVTSLRSAAATLADSYTGLPFDQPSMPAAGPASTIVDLGSVRSNA